MTVLTQSEEDELAQAIITTELNYGYANSVKVVLTALNKYREHVYNQSLNYIDTVDDQVEQEPEPEPEAVVEEVSEEPIRVVESPRKVRARKTTGV